MNTRDENRFDEGASAFERGYALCDCRYAPDTPARSEWEAGWREMERALLENFPHNDDDPLNGHPWHWEL